MNSTTIPALSLMMLLLLSVSTLAQGDSRQGISNMWNAAKEEGGRALTITKIKAAYADRKDIPGRYIRVRFDGKTLQLAGFVPTKDVETAVIDLATRIAKPQTVQKFLTVEPTVPTNVNYNTYLGEQSHDAILKAKILTSLAGPAVRPQLTHADIVHVGVDHGNVTIYIIADAEPSTFDLNPYVKPIPGVESVNVLVVKTY